MTRRSQVESDYAGLGVASELLRKQLKIRGKIQDSVNEALEKDIGTLPHVSRALADIDSSIASLVPAMVKIQEREAVVYSELSDEDLENRLRSELERYVLSLDDAEFARLAALRKRR